MTPELQSVLDQARDRAYSMCAHSGEEIAWDAVKAIESLVPVVSAMAERIEVMERRLKEVDDRAAPKVTAHEL